MLIARLLHTSIKIDFVYIQIHKTKQTNGRLTSFLIKKLFTSNRFNEGITFVCNVIVSLSIHGHHHFTRQFEVGYPFVLGDSFLEVSVSS